MTKISVTVDDKEVRRALDRLSDRAADTRRPMNVIGALLTSKIQAGFRDSGDPWGIRWEPIKHRKGQPLRDTGRLMSSITHRVLDGGSAVEVGTNVVYAAMQQFGAKKGAFGSNKRGSPIPWGDVPARAFMPIRRDGRAELPQSWQRQIARIIEQHLEQ